jgi:hypothetical protein
MDSYKHMSQSLEIQNWFNNVSRVYPVGSLVFVLLGDSVPLGMSKAKAHAGPYVVSHIINSSNYAVAGADNIPVPVHVNKLLPFSPSAADISGSIGSSLAASAIGAAEARIFAHEAMLLRNAFAPKALAHIPSGSETNLLFLHQVDSSDRISRHDYDELHHGVRWL